jgi:GDP-L-fucose synthase
MINFYRNRNILVTGGSGFVGTNLVRALDSLGANVRSIQHLRSPQETLHRVEYMNLNLEDYENCLRACNGVDYVFMAAANSSGAGVMANTPLVHLTPNVVMNSYMLSAAYESKVQKFCFISSNTVYPLSDIAVKEADAGYEFYEKYHIVAWMKRFSEIMCDMYSAKVRAPMKTVVVRPGNLYGPFDKYSWTESKVIAALIRRAIERHDPFKVWGDGLDIKDFLYIDDFIDGLLKVTALPGNHGPINIASGSPITIREVINTILEASEYKNANIAYDQSMPSMIPKRIIDISYIKELTDWVPKVDIRTGITKTINWYKEYYTNYKRTPEELNDY